MFIVQIASECAPVAKVGGLADVVFGLTRELEVRGNSVEVILPKYDCMRYDHIYGLTPDYEDLPVPWGDGVVHCTVWFGFVHGRKCFFIEPHSPENFFNRGCFYGQQDDALRFAFFSKAAMEFLYKSGKRPEIIHVHDWQTALAPVYLYELYAHTDMTTSRVCFTIHNFKHQGVAGSALLDYSGLGHHEYFLANERLGDDFHPGAVNLMKGGLVYSNFVTTVSPHHAWEAQHTEQGQGLGHWINVHASKFGGVLNGLDYEMWNPELDSMIPYQYNPSSLEAKYGNKKALRDRLLLKDDYAPIVSYIGRLDTQKGIHLIRHAIFYCLSRGAQFVLLGSSPNAEINASFWQLKNELNDNPDVHLEIGFNEELAHLIYAGSDMVIVPSMYEPCGLTQMIGLRYGTVPIVRAVGGLADTVFDRDHAWKYEHERNGFVFDHPDAAGVESALERAIGLWYDYPEEFKKLALTGMNYDYSWNYPGQDYTNIYEYIRHR